MSTAQAAHEAIAAAVAEGCRSGLEPWEIQDALAHGYFAVGRLDQKAVADARSDRDQAGLDDNDHTCSDCDCDCDFPRSRRGRS